MESEVGENRVIRQHQKVVANLLRQLRFVRRPCGKGVVVLLFLISQPEGGSQENEKSTAQSVCAFLVPPWLLGCIDSRNRFRFKCRCLRWVARHALCVAGSSITQNGLRLAAGCSNSAGEAHNREIVPWPTTYEGRSLLIVSRENVPGQAVRLDHPASGRKRKGSRRGCQKAAVPEWASRCSHPSPPPSSAPGRLAWREPSWQ